MKNFNWKAFMRTHPLFAALNEREIEEILCQAEQKEFDRDTLIVREGEVSDTIFVIGAGSVQVLLSGKAEQERALSTLGKGEVFGEMAVIDKRPRSATVKANESSIVLEVQGQEFLKVLGEHPDLEFKVLLKLSERLRILNDQLLTIRVHDVDEKLKLFNSKLDAELKAVEASLKAAQTVFDQTKIRTDEVINSAERSRSRLNTTVTLIASIAGIVGAVLGGVAYSALQDIKALHTEAAASVKDIQDAKASSSELTRLRGSLATLVKTVADNALMPMFDQALKNNQQVLAAEAYQDMQKLTANPTLVKTLLRRIKASLIEDYRKDFTMLLSEILPDASDPEDVITCRYLLRVNTILLPPEPSTQKLLDETEKTFGKFDDYVTLHKESRISRDEKMQTSLDHVFAQQEKSKQEEFQRLNELALTPEIPNVPSL